MKPSEIPLGYYTHIFYSFALIHPQTFHITDMDAETGKHYREVTGLKSKQPDLEVWIAIGGWAMNDPGDYRTTFSDLAKSDAAQDAFFESLITFMGIHNFDGVDIDWEVNCPVLCPLFVLDLDLISCAIIHSTPSPKIGEAFPRISTTFRA